MELEAPAMIATIKRKIESADERLSKRQAMKSHSMSTPPHSTASKLEYTTPVKKPVTTPLSPALSSPPAGPAASSDDDELFPDPKYTTSAEKPPYSYATLIGMSILQHPDKKLTLSHIYNWISSNFQYYKRTDLGWQNSIRHNLSLNKAFIKTEKSNDGKGHYWEIKEGMEEQFLKGRKKERRRKAQSSSCSSSVPQQTSLLPAAGTVGASKFGSHGGNMSGNVSKFAAIDNFAIDAVPLAYEINDGFASCQQNKGAGTINHNKSCSRSASILAANAGAKNSAAPYGTAKETANADPNSKLAARGAAAKASSNPSSMSFESFKALYKAESDYESESEFDITKTPEIKRSHSAIGIQHTPEFFALREDFDVCFNDSFSSMRSQQYTSSFNSSFEAKSPAIPQGPLLEPFKKIQKTPIPSRPCTSQKMMWQSPNYLDDYYASPLQHKEGSPYKRKFFETSGSLLFGVDVCSVLERAASGERRSSESTHDEN